MSVKKISEKYYTSSQARAVLGMTKDSFNYYVKTGKIEKTVIPPRTQGVYLKSEIDRLALRIEAILLADEPMELEYRRATLDDIEAENHLAYLVFGQRALTPETRAARRRFVEVNPDMTYHLYDRERLVSSINLVPLKHDAILEFIEGKRGWAFPVEAIEQFLPGKPLECIIIDFMTTPTVPPEKRERYAMHLLMGLSKTMREFGERGVEIKSVSANGGTEQGRRLLETAGFAPIGERSDERDQRIKRMIYSLDVQSSHMKLLKPYKEALSIWKQEQVPNYLF